MIFFVRLDRFNFYRTVAQAEPNFVEDMSVFILTNCKYYTEEFLILKNRIVLQKLWYIGAIFLTKVKI